MSSFKYSPVRSMVVQGRTIINNMPHAATQDVQQNVIPLALPILLKVWDAIEQACGYAWRCTSYIRMSASHQYGVSLDLAPDMDGDLISAYAHTRNSDPILHSRPVLLNKLLVLRDVSFSPLCDVIIAVESDHLHVQLVPQGKFGPHPVNVIRWQTYKPLYHDTVQRNSITAGLRSLPID